MLDRTTRGYNMEDESIAINDFPISSPVVTLIVSDSDSSLSTTPSSIVKVEIGEAIRFVMGGCSYFFFSEVITKVETWESGIQPTRVNSNIVGWFQS